MTGPLGLLLGCALLLDGSGAEHALVCNDQQDGGLLEVRAAARADGLWVGLRFDAPESADSGSGLVLHLDADGDATTGDRQGCELVFDLKARHGSLHPDRTLHGSGHLFEQLGLRVTPAFASNECEFFLPRGELFQGDQVRFFVVSARDRAPDAGWISLQWTDDVTAPAPVTLERSGVRVASWNIEHDGLFREGAADPLRRLITALDADVLVVCESFLHDAEAVQDQVESLLGRPDYIFARKADAGNVVLSRYPITNSWSILDGPEHHDGHRVSAVMVQTPQGPLMVLPQHWRCCAKEGQRLYEADAVIAFLRDAFTAGGNFDLPGEVPFVILGDLNLVETRRPLEVVLTGGVTDKDSFAPDFPPGPGRTPLRAVELCQLDAPFTSTWRDSGSKYYPAQLDWVLLPDNVRVLQGFILDTATMSTARLGAADLKRDDSTAASDHSPVVVDLQW